MSVVKSYFFVFQISHRATGPSAVFLYSPDRKADGKENCALHCTNKYNNAFLYNTYGNMYLLGNDENCLKIPHVQRYNAAA